MKTDATRVYRMAFAGGYPHYIQKAEKKGRAKAGLDAVICWLTGYDENIEDPLMQKIRYLDKLMDELAKGRVMEKILRR